MDRWEPKQETNPVKAIRQMCLECMGGGKPFDLIEACTSPKCALYAFRFGTNPYRKQVSEARREAARKQAQRLNG